MQLFVDGLRPDAHVCALERGSRIERIRGKGFLQILANDGGFDDHGSVVHEHWHDGLWVQRAKFRRELLALQDVDVAARPREPLLGERETHFRRARGRAVVIELEGHGQVEAGRTRASS